MKVIFLQNVEGVAMKGEIREVAPGHAANFLFPNGFAEPATKEAIAKLEHEKKEQEKAALADLVRVQALAARLDGFEVELEVRASPSGTFYSAVTEQMILSALKSYGFKLDGANIVFKREDPIKEEGEYEAVVNLEHGLEAEIKIIARPKS